MDNLNNFFSQDNYLDGPQYNPSDSTTNQDSSNDINDIANDLFKFASQESYNPNPGNEHEYKPALNFEISRLVPTVLLASENFQNAPATPLGLESYNSSFRMAPTVFLSFKNSFSSHNFASIINMITLQNKVGSKDLRTEEAPRLDIPGLPPVGFDNTGYCNCWANSLLHLIFSIPAYEKTYLEIAEYYSKSKISEIAEIGEKLSNVSLIYYECLSKQLTVPKDVAQEFRLALSMLSAGIPKSPYVQCDPHEALLLMLETYQEICKEKWKDNPIFSEIKVKERFIDVGGPSISTEIFKKMPLSKIIEETRFQAVLDFELPNQKDIDFETLKQNFFNNPEAKFSDPAIFQIGEGIINSFQKTEERQIFSKSPNQFLLSLKRFGVLIMDKVDKEPKSEKEVKMIKILTKTEVPLQLIMTPEETGEDRNYKYELVNFIVHIGSYEGGHYVHFRKLNNQWIMLNDANRALVSENEITQILSGKAGDESTSYLHFYIKTEVDLNPSSFETEKPSSEESEPMLIDLKKDIKPIVSTKDEQKDKLKNKISSIISRLTNLKRPFEGGPEEDSPKRRKLEK